MVKGMDKVFVIWCYFLFFAPWKLKNKLTLGESMCQENFSAEDGTSPKCWEALTFTFSKNKYLWIPGQNLRRRNCKKTTGMCRF